MICARAVIKNGAQGLLLAVSVILAVAPARKKEATAVVNKRIFDEYINLCVAPLDVCYLAGFFVAFKN